MSYETSWELSRKQCQKIRWVTHAYVYIVAPVRIYMLNIHCIKSYECIVHVPWATLSQSKLLPRPGIEPGWSSVWRSPNWAIAAWYPCYRYRLNMWDFARTGPAAASINSLVHACPAQQLGQAKLGLSIFLRRMPALGSSKGAPLRGKFGPLVLETWPSRKSKNYIWHAPLIHTRWLRDGTLAESFHKTCIYEYRQDGIYVCISNLSLAGWIRRSDTYLSFLRADLV